MAWDQNKNDIFFRRCKNWAGAVVNLLEERDRLIDLYQNEANGDAAFVDTNVATTAEVIALAAVMNSLDAMINNAAVAQSDRIPLLTPFLSDQE